MLHPAVEQTYLTPSTLDDITLVFTHDKIHEAAYKYISNHMLLIEKYPWR
jgi:hypothetical protein